ncbi:MAG TPA: patatin-like phospholipase family protein [Gemmataceae bacterium]|nr:patatin-like phospholipase family protein [Gemmataceae bacterium]
MNIGCKRARASFGRSRKDRTNAAILVCGVLLFSGCAHAPLNKPLPSVSGTGGYRVTAREFPKGRGDLLLLLFFSGGGMRAAGFSYGVLEELNATEIPVQGRTDRLLNQVDSISAVSGGAFTAAYYCLYGPDAFSTYEKRFLKRNIQSQLLLSCLRPDNAVRLMSPYYGRSDVAAAYYDRHLFHHATYQQLASIPGRPFLVINATDLENGARFSFTQTSFDLLASDLGPYPIGRAVAASSAVPLLLTPITLRNYSRPGATPPVRGVEEEDILTDRLKRLVFELSIYSSFDGHGYVHLVDGGVSDNLGLRAMQEFTMLNGGLSGTLKAMNLANVDKIAVIVVDSSIHNKIAWSQSEAIPGTFSVLAGIGNSFLSRDNYETTELFRQSMRLWQLEMEARDRVRVAQGHSPRHIRFYDIGIDFSGVPGAQSRATLYQLPTGFSLPPQSIDLLRTSARQALKANAEYNRLLDDLRTPETAGEIPSESNGSSRQTSARRLSDDGDGKTQR